MGGCYISEAAKCELAKGDIRSVINLSRERADLEVAMLET